MDDRQDRHAKSKDREGKRVSADGQASSDKRDESGDNEGSNSLLLDDLLLGEEDSPPMPGDKNDEGDPFDFDSSAEDTAEQTNTGFSSREDFAVFEDSDLSSLALDEDESKASKSREPAEAQPSDVITDLPPVDDDLEDTLPDLAPMDQLEEPSAASGGVDESPPLDDVFDLKMVPIDDEEDAGPAESTATSSPRKAEDTGADLLFGEEDEPSEQAVSKPGQSGSSVEDFDMNILSIDEAGVGDRPGSRSAESTPRGVAEGGSSLLLDESDDESGSGINEVDTVDESVQSEPDISELDTVDESSQPTSAPPGDRSALLADFGLDDQPERTRPETPPAASSTYSDPGSGEMGGGSSLLLASDTGEATGTPAPASTRGRRKGKKAKTERVKIVPPKPGKKIEWFSNPAACAKYCRKHKRPLLLYFNTGDPRQCESYETTVKMDEVQAFLGPYVCCTADLRVNEVRQVAQRLGLPTDGPSMIVLSPTGREFARIVKPTIDWQFAATMLFWALR